MSENVKFKLLKVFQKELTYKSSDNIQSTENLSAGINLELDAMNLEKNVFLSSLRIKFSATADTKPMFEIFVNMCGIFACTDQEKTLSEEEIKNAVQITFPTAIFPYARQIISQTAYNGGFSNVVMDTIDFEELRLNQQKNETVN